MRVLTVQSDKGKADVCLGVERLGDRNTNSITTFPGAQALLGFPGVFPLKNGKHYAATLSSSSFQCESEAILSHPVLNFCSSSVSHLFFYCRVSGFFTKPIEVLRLLDSLW